jgi:hypothetical protein
VAFVADLFFSFFWEIGMYKNGKKMETEKQRRRRERRGKGGTRDVVRQIDEGSDDVLIFPLTPPPLLLSEKSKKRVAVAKERIRTGCYDDSQIIGATVRILQEKLSA